MSLGQEQGGLPPQSTVQTDEAILYDSERLVRQYHDADEGSMVNIALAPCSPFSVTSDLMRETARLARKYGVRLHTHLAENHDEVERTAEPDDGGQACREKEQRNPSERPWRRWTAVRSCRRRIPTSEADEPRCSKAPPRRREP